MGENIRLPASLSPQPGAGYAFDGASLPERVPQILEAGRGSRKAKTLVCVGLALVLVFSFCVAPATPAQGRLERAPKVVRSPQSPSSRSAQEVVEAFLTGWKLGNYGYMATLISPSWRQQMEALMHDIEQSLYWLCSPFSLASWSLEGQPAAIESGSPVSVNVLVEMSRGDRAQQRYRCDVTVVEVEGEWYVDASFIYGGMKLLEESLSTPNPFYAQPSSWNDAQAAVSAFFVGWEYANYGYMALFTAPSWWQREDILQDKVVHALYWQFSPLWLNDWAIEDQPGAVEGDSSYTATVLAEIDRRNEGPQHYRCTVKVIQTGDKWHVDPSFIVEGMVVLED